MFASPKITRKNLGSFLVKHQTSKLTLNVGSGTNNHPDYFPNVHNLDINTRGEVDILANICKSPFLDNSYQQILCLEVLEHLPNPQQAIDELFRILEPGGKLILTTRFIYPLHDVPHDYFRYTRYGITYLFNKWPKVEIYEDSTTQESVLILLQRIQFQTEILISLPIFNILLGWLIKLLQLFPNLIIKQYGDVTRKNPVPQILSAGYYVVAYKNRDKS